jgi:hypothetical protein
MSYNYLRLANASHCHAEGMPSSCLSTIIYTDLISKLVEGVLVDMALGTCFCGVATISFVGVFDETALSWDI